MRVRTPLSISLDWPARNGRKEGWMMVLLDERKNINNVDDTRAHTYVGTSRQVDRGCVKFETNEFLGLFFIVSYLSLSFSLSLTHIHTYTPSSSLFLSLSFLFSLCSSDERRFVELIN